MTREQLVESAAVLKTPGMEAIGEFAAKRERMAAMVNQTMGRRPDLEKLVGEDGRQMSEDNNRNFSLFMESLMSAYKPEVLVDTALWVFRAYRSHGFNTIYWPANLSTWVQTLKTELSQKGFEEIFPFYAWLVSHVPVFARLTDHVVKDRENAF